MVAGAGEAATATAEGRVAAATGGGGGGVTAALGPTATTAPGVEVSAGGVELWHTWGRKE